MKVLVVSDIHANLTALEAVLSDCEEVDAIWNLGDTVGYGPKPHECLKRMIGLGANPFLVGNHDLASVGKIAISDFNPIAAMANQWTATQLTIEDCEFIAKLSPTAEADDYTLAHGSPRHPVWEYILEKDDATENFKYFNTNVCMVGHTHVAMYAVYRTEKKRTELHAFKAGETLDLSFGRYIVNPGSVGQPRDGDPRAAFAVLDTENRTITAHRVAYDVFETQRQMREAGLPAPLISRLARGR